MSAILTADVHWNSKPSDEYRWGLLDWLGEEHRATELIIAGDLTDAKDHHPARLVNRLHSAINRLRYRVIIVRGNHDYYDVNYPFFEFLGDGSDIVFATEPMKIDLTIGTAFLVPAGVDWGSFKIPKVDYLFTHATFSGAKAENGQSLTGVDPAVLGDFDGQVYSGDIHVPQTLDRGRIVYIGAPYHTRFGDDFEPRLLWVDSDGSTKDLYYPAPRKYTLRITRPDDLLGEKVRRGDHVKVKCLLRRSEYDKWREYSNQIRMIASDRGWLLFGADPVAIELAKAERSDDSGDSQPVSHEELLMAYAKQQKASEEYVEAGISLLAGD